MKKVLFATTALVATAGFAAADVTAYGSAKVGLDSNSGGNTSLDTILEFGFKASGTTDNGLTFGASMDIETKNDGGVSTDNVVNDPEVYISGAFGTLTFGDVAVASDMLGQGDLGFDGIGIDNVAEGQRNQGSADVNYKYTVDAFTIVVTAGLTQGTNDGDLGVAVAYSANGLSAELGFSSDDSANTDATSVQLGYSADGLGIDALFVDGPTSDSWGVQASYTMDALKVTLGVADSDTSTDTSYGVGAVYTLGGGMALNAGLGEVNGQSEWELGLTMSF